MSNKTYINPNAIKDDSIKKNHLYSGFTNTLATGVTINNVTKSGTNPSFTGLVDTVVVTGTYRYPNSNGTVDLGNLVDYSHLTSVTTAASTYHTSSQLKANLDLRSENTNPSDYNHLFKISGLKYNSGLTLNNEGTYSTVLGARAWGDKSGGPAHEFALTFNGNICHRSGNEIKNDSNQVIPGGWGEWERIITDKHSASTSVYGVTKLSNSTSSNAEDIAATPKAVKSAYDLANSAYNLASSTASTGAYGVTKLSNSTSSTAENLAATPKAVKSAYDLANSANTKANSAYNLASSTASTSVYGVTKLSSSTSSNSEDIAATLKAVKSAYDLASSAKTKADTAVTGIQMNGGLKTKNTNGVVNLGTVITSLTAATTAVTGVVRLSSSTSSPNDEVHAATPKAVAAVSSLANGAYDKATANTESINALSSSVVKKIQMNANLLSPINGTIDLGFVNGTPVTWDANKNMNDFTNPGIYLISGQRTSGTDNLPIYNTGSISGRLVVITSNNCVSQILTLSNAGGGDTNIYTRTKQGEVWEPWGKLQTNIEVGQIGFGTPYTFDDFTDNGMYSGVNTYWVDSTSTYSAETFVLVVINGYLYGGGITQLKYSIMADGKVNLHTRKKMGNSNWSDWEMYGGLQNTYENTDTQTLLPDNSIVDKGLNSLKETGLYYGTHINDIDSGSATKIDPFVLATFDNGSLTNRTGISQLKINTNRNEGAVLETRRYNTSNNTWTDWLTISGKDTIPEIIVDGLNYTSTVVNMKPNTYYRITNFNNLTLNFLSGVDNTLKNYMLEITLDKDAPITFTSVIKWADGVSPVFEKNNTYQISIINNLGVFTVFTNN